MMMNFSDENPADLFGALVAAASEITAIPKAKQAYGYRYATLDGLIDMLRGVLPKHGLWFTQAPITDDSGALYLYTRVYHKSGEWMDTAIQVEKADLAIQRASEVQKIGAAITYYRRYSLASIFGVSADEDTDAQKPAHPESPKNHQKDPMTFALGIMAKRMSAGETRESVMADYAEILGFKSLRDLKDLSADDVTRLARKLYTRAFRAEVSRGGEEP